MFKVHTFVLGPIETNAYLILNKEKQKAIVIDPGMNPGMLLDKLKQDRIDVEAILLTHAHFDHIAGLDQLCEATNAPVYVHEAEVAWLNDASKNGSAVFIDGGVCFPDISPYLVKDKQTLSLLGTEVYAIHTPGHSPGSMTYRMGHNVFCGDLVFQGSVGRTDLYGGNAQQLQHSLQNLRDLLPSDCILFPGHGPNTNWKQEKMTNPWF